MTPAAPPTVWAVPGNRSASVFWTTPAANGSAITNYFVTPYIGGRAQTPIELGVVRSAHLTGLTNAKTYEFHVAAQNAEGTGPARSSPSITVGAPVAPTGVRARFRNGSVTVHWKQDSIVAGGTQLVEFRFRLQEQRFGADRLHRHSAHARHRVAAAPVLIGFLVGNHHRIGPRHDQHVHRRGEKRRRHRP